MFDYLFFLTSALNGSSQFFKVAPTPREEGLLEVQLSAYLEDVAMSSKLLRYIGQGQEAVL